MFALVIEREGEPTRRRVFGRENNVAIGRAEHCGVLLDDPAIAEVHALVIVEKDRLSIQAHRGSSVFVDGKSIGERATKLTSARIGAYTLRVATLDQPRTKLTLAATEEQLLAAIAGGDDASRLVYADWARATRRHHTRRVPPRAARPRIPRRRRCRAARRACAPRCCAAAW